MVYIYFKKNCSCILSYRASIFHRTVTDGDIYTSQCNWTRRGPRGSWSPERNSQTAGVTDVAEHCTQQQNVCAFQFCTGHSPRQPTAWVIKQPCKSWWDLNPTNICSDLNQAHWVKSVTSAIWEAGELFKDSLDDLAKSCMEIKIKRVQVTAQWQSIPGVNPSY